MSPTQVGFIGCAALVLLLTTSMPVAFSMTLVGVAGFAYLKGMDAAFRMATSGMFDTFSDYNLTVIPLFVLMGQVAFHAGISRRLYASAYAWLGWLPGGLAMATVGACTAFGAICGSGPATSATMAAVALPEMKRYHYNMELATGTVASGGSIGMMIPPSVVFIVYGILTEQSIGKLFISGVIPGLLTAVVFCGTIWWMCRRRPELGPPGPAVSLREKIVSLSGTSETLILFLLVMGGMFAGFFTATEAAAVGAAGTIVIALVRRQLSWTGFVRALMETARTSCMVMVIVCGAIIFGRFLAVTRLPFELATWLGNLPLWPWVIVSGIVLFYLVGGCFVDALALLLLTVPIFYPVILNLGYDPIWFGVIIVLVTQMGVITPPVGVCVYVVSGMERDVPLQGVFRGSMPFLWGLIAVTALVVAFPQLATFLPGLMR